MIDEDVREVSLLVNDTLEVALVIRERRLRLLYESLDPAERRVLNDDVRREVLHDRIVVPGIQDDGDVCSTCVAHQLIHEYGWRRTCNAMALNGLFLKRRDILTRISIWICIGS